MSDCCEDWTKARKDGHVWKTASGSWAIGVFHEQPHLSAFCLAVWHCPWCGRTARRNK